MFLSSAVTPFSIILYGTCVNCFVQVFSYESILFRTVMYICSAIFAHFATGFTHIFTFIHLLGGMENVGE